MGRKNPANAALAEAEVAQKAVDEVKAAEAKEADAKDDKKTDETEDTPFIKELKVLDDKYLAIEREYEKECNEVRKKFAEKQKPVLEQRRDLLLKPDADGGDGAKTGTPACQGFWLQALKHHPAFEERIEEWDEPVLEYLKDITTTNTNESDPSKGFRIDFLFAENPYFTNETLWKVYEMEESSPYTQEYEPKSIKCSVCDWKPGKDVTIEKVAKKVKGGGAKKAKQKGKVQEEPRDSFFRHGFRTLEPGMPLPQDINAELEGLGEDDEDEPEEAILQMLMGSDQEMGACMRDQIVPFAVRWYTGEASPEEEDDDEDDDDEDDDDDDDDDDEDSDEESEDDAPKGRKGGGGGRKPAKGGKPGKDSPATKPSGDPKQEECKQQ